VHFSGANHYPGIFGVHPFASFSHTLFDVEFYRKMLFVCEVGTPFSDLFPQFRNPVVFLKPEQKARYHAQCVLLANGLAVLLNGSQRELESISGISSRDISRFNESVSQNVLGATQAPDLLDALTGPIVREDEETVATNLASLEKSHWTSLYIWIQDTINKLKRDP